MASLDTEIAVMGRVAVLVVPSVIYLYWLQQRGQLGVTTQFTHGSSESPTTRHAKARAAG